MLLRQKRLVSLYIEEVQPSLNKSGNSSASLRLLYFDLIQ